MSDDEGEKGENGVGEIPAPPEVIESESDITNTNVSEEIKIPSKAQLLKDKRKKQSHLLMFGGKTGIGKSTTLHTLAKDEDIDAFLIETEGKALYHDFPKNRIARVTTYEGMKKAIMTALEKTDCKIIVDSFSMPIKLKMSVADDKGKLSWQDYRKLYDELVELVKAMQMRGGVLVVHGKWKRKPDLLGRDNVDKLRDKVPDGEFVPDGSHFDYWGWLKTGTVILGLVDEQLAGNVTAKLMMQVWGNNIPLNYLEYEIIKGNDGKPVCRGEGYEYLKKLIKEPRNQ